MAIPFITQLPEAPRRTDARPDFALRADVFFAAIDPMRYQMNQMAAWMNDQRDDIYSYSDNVEAWMNATLDARNAAQSAATNAAASESAAKDHLDDTAALIAAFTPTGDPLPEVTSVNAPLVVATPQGGVKFSRRALNNGAGVRPALRFDFANQGYLDPRITFTRATPDWDWNGKRYEANEPVLSDEGLWLWGSRTNLWPYAMSLSPTSPNTVRGGELSIAEGTGRFARGVTLSITGGVGSYYYIEQPGTDFSDRHTFTAYISVEDGGKPIIGQVSVDSSLDASFLAAGTTSEDALNLVPSIEHSFGNIWKFTATFNRPESPSRSTGFLKRASHSSRSLTIWAIQLETGGFATPLIPTNGSQVTVAASTLEVLADSLSGKFNPNEGTIVWRVGRNHYSSAAGTPPHANMGIVGGGSNNGLLAISGNSLVYHDSNGDYQESLAVPAQPFSNDEFTIAYTYTKTGVSVSHNGELASAEWDVSEFLENAVNRLYVSGLTNGYVRSLSYYDHALTDEQLQELAS